MSPLLDYMGVWWLFSSFETWMIFFISRAQKFSKRQMLEELVSTAIHWIETGLLLSCLKIVLLEGEHENMELLLRFKAMKESYQKGRMEKQKV